MSQTTWCWAIHGPIFGPWSMAAFRPRFCAAVSGCPLACTKLPLTWSAPRGNTVL